MRTRSHGLGLALLAFVGDFALVGRTASAAPAASTDPTAQDCYDATEKALGFRRMNKLRAAREQYMVCAARSCKADIRNDCTRYLNEINLEIPTVVFDVLDTKGGNVTPVRVWMDGAPLSDHLGEVPLSVDPGKHVFRFEAPGMKTIEKTFTLIATKKAVRLQVDMETGEDADTNAADAAFDAGKWSTALPIYKQLYAQSGDPYHLRRQAICLQKLVASGAENPESALEVINRYLKLPNITEGDRAWANEYRDGILALKGGPKPEVATPNTQTTAVAIAPLPAASPPTTVSTAPAVLEGSPAPGPSAGHPSRTTLGIAALATGGAFLVSAALVWKSADSKYDSIRAACNSGCTSGARADAVSSVQTRDRLAVGGLIVGGALVAAGVVALVIPAGTERTGLSLAADPSAKTLLLGGRF